MTANQKVTTQKVSAILHAKGISRVTVSGFYPQYGAIEINAEGSDAVANKESYLAAAQALQAKGVVPFIKVNQRGSLTYSIVLQVSKDPSKVVEDAFPFSVEKLDELCAPIIAAHLKYLNDRKEERERRNKEADERYARRLAEARRLNPNIQITIIEQSIDQAQGVAFSTVKDSRGCNQHILMEWSTRESFFNGKMTKSVHIYHAPGIGSTSSGGSTSVDGVDTLEAAALSYVATWHVDR